MTLDRPITRSPVASLALDSFAGGVWGLALARALAETFPGSPTLEFPPTALLALVTASLVGIGRRITNHTLRFTFYASPFKHSNPLPLLLPGIYVLWPSVAPHVGWILLGGSLALRVLLAVERARILPYLLVGVTLAFYLRTLGPTVGQADTFEFQVTAPKLGVAHPTGYPLYTLLGKLFSLPPLGSVAWRVNLSSAIFGTAAALILYHLIHRLTRRPSVAGIAALAFAFSRVFWSQAVVAEVYTLNNLFVAAILLLLVDWISSGRNGIAESLKNTDDTETSSAKSVLLSASAIPLLALLLGLSFSNHLTTALLLPAAGLTLLFARPRISWRGWLAAGGLFALGLSLYLYIYFRWPALRDGVWMSPSEFWRYITGQQFGGALRLDAWRTDPTRYEIVGRLLREPFGWPGLTLGTIGLAWLGIKRWRVALITLVTFAAYAWYALSYYVPDVSVFMLPAHLVLAIWLGVGMAALLEIDLRGLLGSLLLRLSLDCQIRRLGKVNFDSNWASRTGIWQSPSSKLSSNLGSRMSALLLSLFALLPLSLLWTNLSLVDQSNERATYAWGDRVLELPLAPDAAILADSARIAPLYYLQRIEGRRADLDMLVLADEALYRAELETRVAAGQTVYLARFLPGLEGRYHLRSLGPLTEVGTAPLMEPPALDQDLGVHLGPLSTKGAGVELLGLTGPVPGPDGGTGLTLYWRADAPIGEVFHVRLRLVDEDGKVWWGGADVGRHAANNYYPTPAWHPGEVVPDYHEVPPLITDPTASPGNFTLQVGLFRPFSDEGLVTAEGEAWVSLLPFEPLAPTDSPAPTHPLRARFSSSDGDGDLTLVGGDLPDVAAASATVELTLHWRGNHTPDRVRPALTWSDSKGTSAPAQVLEAWGRARLSLRTPTSPGDYVLRLGLMDGDGGALSARCGWLARPTHDCALATVRVAEGIASMLADFDGKMALLDAELGVSALEPGAILPVALRWQGRRPMAEDYTVSVQVIGSDGRLYGQVDAWPVQGTLPTSQWTPGQTITDPYQVQIKPDTPPGRYRVGVVVYLLATQTRLPLIDASGQAVGDIAWLGEVMVRGEE